MIIINVYLVSITYRFLLHSTQANDSSEFFLELKSAQTDVFQWLQDEFHNYLGDQNPARQRRDTTADNGDDWYRNFECRVNNKSCSIGMPFNDNNGQQQSRGGKKKIIANHSRQERIQSTSRNEKLHFPNYRNDDNARMNDVKGMNDEQQQQHLVVDVSDHHAAKNSNDNSAINGLLNVRASIAARQNEIHEIELKHQQHLAVSSPSTYSEETLLNDNQLDDVGSQQQQQQTINEYSSNINLQPNSDASLVGNGNHLSGQKQMHYDDQIDTKQNDLLDELKDMPPYQQQILEFNEPHHRVKRRDAINRMSYGSGREFDGLENVFDYDSFEMERGEYRCWILLRWM